MLLCLHASQCINLELQSRTLTSQQVHNIYSYVDTSCNKTIENETRPHDACLTKLELKELRIQALTRYKRHSLLLLHHT